MSLHDRLIERREVVGDCWIFTGARTGGGYGSIGTGGRHGKRHYTHRLSYELHVGPIPDGMQIDHLCRVRACFNPAHLEAVPQAVNVRRGMSGAHNAVKTHCPQGHPYSEENTYRSPKNQRFCVACRRARYHARKAA